MLGGCAGRVLIVALLVIAVVLLILVFAARSMGWGTSAPSVLVSPATRILARAAHALGQHGRLRFTFTEQIGGRGSVWEQTIGRGEMVVPRTIEHERFGQAAGDLQMPVEHEYVRVGDRAAERTEREAWQCDQTQFGSVNPIQSGDYAGYTFAPPVPVKLHSALAWHLIGTRYDGSGKARRLVGRVEYWIGRAHYDLLRHTTEGRNFPWGANRGNRVVVVDYAPLAAEVTIQLPLNCR